jgi:ubiquinone/menaquinone biosynthesis C-methylase UbiE
MSNPLDPHQEHPSTYIVQDRSNEEEMLRLQLQDKLTTEVMGGVLPEQEDPGVFQSVLDVGCGTGGWLIELTKTYPHISRLIGVDVSGRMLDFARAQAAAEGLSERIEFLMMDALRMLEFPDEYFDLVNQRLGNSYLRSWDWPKLLQEYKRVTRPYGVIRITEGDIYIESSSPALTRLFDLVQAAFERAGYFFKPGSRGVLDELSDLLSRHDIHQVQTRAYVQLYQAGTPNGDFFVKDMALLFRTIKPFLQKWTRLPEDYEAIYQQMLSEIQRPDFVGKARVLTAWGYKL